MKRLIPIVTTVALLFLSSTTIIKAQDHPVQLSLFNPIQLFSENSSISGLRLNLIYGKNERMTGLDFGLINHTTGAFKGVQFGLVGISNSDFTGWQDNAVNITNGKFEGLQWGFFNSAKRMNGVQIGLVNVAGYMDKGLQIGLINIIHQNGAFPFFPIINWSF